MDQILHDGRVITLVHFESAGRIACMQSLTDLHATTAHPQYQRTNDPRATNCPACRRSPTFKVAIGVYGG